MRLNAFCHLKVFSLLVKVEVRVDIWIGIGVICVEGCNSNARLGILILILYVLIHRRRHNKVVDCSRPHTARYIMVYKV